MNIGIESETLEFKKTTKEVKTAMESIVAMLNKHGIGTLYFGVKPNGDVCGQDVSESSLRDVSRMVYESIRPQIYPIIVEEIIEDRHVIKVEFNGDNSPYSAFGRYYLRTADEDREVSPEELKKFFVNNEYKEKWEKGSSAVSAQNYDRKALKDFFETAVKAGRIPEGKYSGPVVLKKLGLINGDYLNHAGEVLFGKTMPVTLKAAIFATDEKLTFLDMKLYEDNVYNLLHIAEEYILKNIRWRVEIEGLYRNEIPEIPIAVIREVLANGFAHSIYNTGTNHEICIFPDKVTFYSPGKYASLFKPEDYIRKNLPSSIRNATISKVLYLNKTIEQFGSGFKRIDSLCKDAGCKYSYENSELGFTFILYRDNGNNVTVNVTDNVTLNKTEQAVLALLSKHPNYTRDQIGESVSKTVRTVQRVIDSLRKKKLVERVGSDKDGYWKVMKP